MLDKPKLTEPNEQGFQFGINTTLTQYAHTGHDNLPPIDITVVEVWKDDKRMAYLLIDEKTQQPVKEVDSGYEAAGCAIDALKFIKQTESQK